MKIGAARKRAKQRNRYRCLQVSLQVKQSQLQAWH
uniref:Uncharacterized protein n=1 Tax=Anguilla anguilla TaxID=7936 RepID=A0A0E9RCM8_ANGAN